MTFLKMLRQANFPKYYRNPLQRKTAKVFSKLLTQYSKLFTTQHLEIYPEPKQNNPSTSSRDRGIPLKIGDKVLHYNKRAGQHLEDKLEGRWLGPYVIVGKHQKNKYQVKDMKGYVFKMYLNGSNLKWYLTKNEVNENDPDLISVSELPDTPDPVNNLLASTNYEKNRPKSKGGKKRKMSDAELLFPDPQGHKKKKKMNPCPISTCSTNWRPKQIYHPSITN